MALRIKILSLFKLSILILGLAGVVPGHALSQGQSPSAHLPGKEQDESLYERLAAEEPLVAEKPPAPGLGARFEQFFSRSHGEQVARFIASLPEEDPRKNRLNISTGAGWIQLNSSSPLQNRQFSGEFGGVIVAANIWLTPELGGFVQNFYSVAADAATTLSSDKVSPVKNEILDFGIKYRKLAGPDGRAPSFEAILYYTDRNFSVPPDDKIRPRLHTSGLVLAAEAYFPLLFLTGGGSSSNSGTEPSNPSTAMPITFNVGVGFGPRLSHQELATGVNSPSGASGESVSFSTKVGALLNWTPHFQTFLEVQDYKEKNGFNGPSNVLDPSTGQSVENNRVLTNTHSLIFGVSWSN